MQQLRQYCRFFFLLGIIVPQYLIAQNTRPISSTEIAFKQKYVPFSDTTSQKINKFFDLSSIKYSLNGSI
jgi:hypothetical protein